MLARHAAASSANAAAAAAVVESAHQQMWVLVGAASNMLASLAESAKTCRLETLRILVVSLSDE